MSQAGDVSRFIPTPPKQVRDGLAAAEELRRSLAQPPAPEAAPPAAPGPAPAAPAQPSLAPPAAPQAQAPAPLGEGETWEQRARSAQGRLDTALNQNRQLAERLGTLEQQIASLTAQGATPPAAPDPNAPKPKITLITPQEETDYGKDMLDVVGKRAREEFFPEFDELSNRLKRLEGRVDGTVQLVTKTAAQDLYQALDGKIVNWREVNRSPQFKAWLANVDPYSGRRKLDLLQEAFTRQEPTRVLSFFEGFLTEATGTPPSQLNPPATPSSSPQAPTGTPAGALTLEQLAAPGRARSAPQGNLPPEKPVYTHAWIAQFMADKRRGKFRGREADADAVERDIYQAQHEGRIV